MTWQKIGRNVNREGTTITYQAKEAPDILIQSRKRHIPHANGIGTWDHTSYFVLFVQDGGNVDVCEKQSLRDAKDYAAIAYETRREMGIV